MITAERRVLSQVKRAGREILTLYRSGGGRTAVAFTARAVSVLPEIIRTHTLSAVDAAMGSRTYTFRVEGQPVQLLGRDFAGAREICCKRVYFPDDRFRIGASDVVVDLGANVGIFTTVAGRLGRRVIAVEEQPQFLELIEDNLRRNGCLDRASVVIASIGGEEGSDRSFVERNSTAARMTMPELIRSRGIPSIDFLKIDIEGAEFHLFSGDVGWLDMVSRIAMEVHPLSGDVGALADLISNAGFDVELRGSAPGFVESAGGPTAYLFAIRSHLLAGRPC